MRWVIVFPKWHHDFSETPLYAERYRVHVEDNLICYGDVMVVYEAVDGPPSAARADYRPGAAGGVRSIAVRPLPRT